MENEEKKKDNARRQAAYRKRRLKEGSDQRLNVILEQPAKQALDAIAHYYGVTNKSVVERLLLEAYAKLIEQIQIKQELAGS
ncbi:hypothetical protein J2X19_000076 [Rhodoferax ferrireducens]|uniref:Protein CopB n=1 Tax=Rhodoferax ferrireducens TaxID=192843 RepID=A0ABU2C286_9BURK|nr:hypothetical protein [Rhodoferax ferrireducens]MDR7375418.1 hypothetical protein [Rhodoferax ferrireducens]